MKLYVGSPPTGTLFAEGGPSGSAPTGDWATPGMGFYLVDGITGQALVSATLGSQATLTANPASLPAGDSQTTLTWNAPGSSFVKLYAGLPATGKLFAEVG